MKFLNKFLTFVAVPLGFFVLLLGMYYLKIFNALIFPNPFLVIVSFIKLFISLQLYSDFIITFLRVFTAVILSVILGVPLGVLLGYNAQIYDLFEFLIDFFRSIPVSALFPFFMLFLGVGSFSKIATATWSTLLIIIVNTSYGIKHSDKAYIKMAKVYKINRTYLFKHILFMGALPYVFSSVRIGTSIALILIILSEMFIGSVNGIGHSILNAHLTYEIPTMYALIIVTGSFGYSLNQILIFLEKRTIHWTA